MCFSGARSPGKMVLGLGVSWATGPDDRSRTCCRNLTTWRTLPCSLHWSPPCASLDWIRRCRSSALATKAGLLLGEVRACWQEIATRAEVAFCP